MPDRSNLLALVGHMKVEQLARLVGLEVEALVAIVAGARPARREADTPSLAGRPEATSTTARSTGRSSGHSVAPRAAAPLSPSLAAGAASEAPEPPLAAMFGHVTHRELHRVVDRWLLDRVLAEEGGNVSHAALRLGISRRTLREHRDRAHDPAVDRWVNEAPLVAPSAAAPEPPSLDAVLTRGGSYRDLRKAVDRWLIGGTLAREHGNITRTALDLGMSRKDLRARWARVRD